MRYGDNSAVGKKMGDWQTIDQRERKAGKARKTQRRGMAAAGTGAGLAGGAYLMGRPGNNDLGPSRNAALSQAKDIGRDAQFKNKAHGILGSRLKSRAKDFGRLATHSAKTRPLGAALIGGTALAGVGAAGKIQGASREAYQQQMINARRRSNAKRGVAKASRYYDADARRRHHMGMAEGATAVSGTALAGYGGVRAARHTEMSNSAALNHGAHDKVRGKDTPQKYKDFADKLNDHNYRARPLADGKKFERGRSLIDSKIPRHLFVDRKSAAALAGGGALLETARRINNRARSDKHRTWN